MKTIFGAIALMLAAPAFAQAAPAADPHAQHKGVDHDQQGKHDCKQCCEKMKGKDGKMECMEKKEGDKPADSHAGHQRHGS